MVQTSKTPYMVQTSKTVKGIPKIGPRDPMMKSINQKLEKIRHTCSRLNLPHGHLVLLLYPYDLRHHVLLHHFVHQRWGTHGQSDPAGHNGNRPECLILIHLIKLRLDIYKKI